MKKYLIKSKKYIQLLIAASVLAACSSSQKSPTIVPINVQPVGAPAPLGFVHQPSGSNARYRVVSYKDLPNWSSQPFEASLQAFKNSCLKLAVQHDWQYACARANQTAANYLAAKAFFEHNFSVWQVSQDGQLAGKITGYYEPVLHGDTRRTNRSRFPIYGVPRDFISVPLPSRLKNSRATVRISQTGINSGVIQANGQYLADLAQFPIFERTSALKGRIVGNRFVPYFTRAQINGGALDDGRAPILGYADDPVELFFMHIQGSGRLQTSSGQYIRLGFADKNEYPYVSIGKYMANRGYLPLAQTSMQAIKNWIAANPIHLAEVLGQNPSYVFFRELSGSSEQGPVGALGVALTNTLSGAVDKQHITLGAPIFVATTHPDTRGALNRLIMAQDTGSAVKGAVRVDYFWGYGDAAGKSAGKHNHTGYVWELLPNGVMPSYRP